MEYLFHILVITGIYIILTQSLNLVIGYTGLPSLGHAAFSCVGAYTSALLALYFGLSPWFGIIIGACAAIAIAAVLGAASLRLKGDYLALATLGFGLIVYSVAKNWVLLTEGPMGLPGIHRFSILGFQLSEAWSYLLLVIAFVLLTNLVLKRIVNSPFGRVLQGVREDEVATLAMGKNVNKYKITVFVVGAFFAGIAGGLYAHYITFIDPSSFTVMESITILLMVVFGGMGSLTGSIIGASILVLLPEILRFIGLPSFVAAPLRQMMYGLLLVVLMLKQPMGLLGKYRFR